MDMSSIASIPAALLKGGFQAAMMYQANKDIARSPHRGDIDFAGKYLTLKLDMNFHFDPASREGSPYVRIMPWSVKVRVGDRERSENPSSGQACVDADTLLVEEGLGERNFWEEIEQQVTWLD